MIRSATQLYIGLFAFHMTSVRFCCLAKTQAHLFAYLSCETELCGSNGA